MKKRGSKKNFLRIRMFLSLWAWLPVAWGCQTQEPPLSPAAQAFKQEVQQAIGLVAKELVRPVARADVSGINAGLEKIMPSSIKLCRACPFMMGVLDPNGVILAIYPPKKDYSRHYSDYKLVMKALERGEICHGRLFLQDGSKLYTICSPLKEEGKAVGILVLTTTDEEVKQRWGLSEEEFAAINFNK
jgi:hypothetical protein